MPRRCPSGDPTRAVAYLRASTDEQRLGPEAQRSSIESWALATKIDVLAWQIDQGVSGGSDLNDRPALGAALALLKSERAGWLVIAKRDRLARDVQVAFSIERAVVACGAQVISADGVGNGSGDADQFLRTILDAAAAYERALIRSRTKAALAAKKARGLRAGEVPFGYHADPSGKLLPTLEEQETISLVLRLRASGLSQRAIAAECNKQERFSRSGTPLRQSQIARILSRNFSPQTPSSRPCERETKRS